MTLWLLFFIILSSEKQLVFKIFIGITNISVVNRTAILNQTHFSALGYKKVENI